MFMQVLIERVRRVTHAKVTGNLYFWGCHYHEFEYPNWLMQARWGHLSKASRSDRNNKAETWVQVPAFLKNWRRPTLAESIKPLPSARLCLTAEFGMGSGRTTALWPPKIRVSENRSQRPEGDL